jgi:hypothetical protein
MKKSIINLFAGYFIMRILNNELRKVYNDIIKLHTSNEKISVLYDELRNYLSDYVIFGVKNG